MTDSTNLSASEFREQQKANGVNQVEINGNRVNLEELNDADAQLASQFGYKPVFKREFGYLSTFSFAVSISGLFATVMTTFSYPLIAGGSASAVWCWLISGAGCMCIAVSTFKRREKLSKDPVPVDLDANEFSSALLLNSYQRIRLLVACMNSLLVSLPLL